MELIKGANLLLRFLLELFALGALGYWGLKTGSATITNAVVWGTFVSPRTPPRPRCCPYFLVARPWLFALEALRGTLGSEIMTTLGGAGTTLGNAPTTLPCSAHRLLLWGQSSRDTEPRPFVLPRSYAAGCSLCTD
jgi:hypothetical protein